ncbi:MAG: hypothetical protein HC905_00880 [Bacteroidales bacterium]|nr:hypothetical protein [Bacteroidales bacterium]
MFRLMPIDGIMQTPTQNKDSQQRFKKDEMAGPGFYQVTLDSVKAELTATSRCAFHRYSFADARTNFFAIDLKHGSDDACTIVQADAYDTVLVANIKWINDRTIQGTRISSGWAKEQHVYFYAQFSKPIVKTEAFHSRKKVDFNSSLEGLDVRLIFSSIVPTAKNYL